ncbi:hypothetical protein BKA70DRAFT_564763 [Coprinopsis sp. MPI-PUGE-AT-0042]|nr:hypothetical protein BKA70DRAFT_564763 [Coprinopsis sp. MPI-PUGE-AT-0042]
MDMETEEDQVNVQDLQAQIDLSMSFAQSLAASWIKPRRNAASSSSRRKELESEIWEAAKRPSRLGVGTSVSQVAQHTSREAARLKGQLVGKRRSREDEEPQTKKPGNGDDDDRDDESRARAITKKVKIDPFDVSSKKKKKQSLQVMGNGSSSLGAHPATEKSPSSSRSGEKAKAGEDTAISFKPFEAKWDASTKSQASTSLLKVDPNHTEAQGKGKGKSATRLDTLSPSEDAPSTQEEHPKAGYLSLVTPLSPDTKLPPELLKRPLLNLSDHSGSEDDSPENPSVSSPKKKRKRRKKKKKQTADGA